MKFGVSPLKISPRTLLTVCLLVALPLGAAGPEFDYERVAVEIQAGKLAGALQTIRDRLDHVPGDVRALDLLGMALTLQHQIEPANEAFRRAIGLVPRYAPALRNLAINEFAAGHTESARDLFARAVRNAPEDDLSHGYLAKLAFADDNCAKGLDEYGRVHGEYSRSPSLVLSSAACLVKRAHYAEAEKTLTKLRPDAWTSHFQAGVMLAGCHLYSQAAGHFNIARMGVPDRAAASFNYLLMLLQAGSWDEVIHEGASMFSGGVQFPELSGLLAEAYLKKGQVQTAWNELRQATEHDPAWEQNYVDLSTIAQDRGNPDLAFEVVEIGIRRNPRSDRLYIQRGILQALRNQLDDAQADFSRARSFGTDATVADLGLAVCLLAANQYDEALKVLRNAAVEDRGHAMIQYMLAKALIRSGADSSDAGEQQVADALTASIRLDPDFAAARAEYGKLLLKRGDVERAIPELEACLRFDPSNRAAMTQLLRAYTIRGEKSLAAAVAARLRNTIQNDRDDENQLALQVIVRASARGNDRRLASESADPVKTR